MGAAEALGSSDADLAARPTPAGGRQGGGGDGRRAHRGHAPVVHRPVGVDRGRRPRSRGAAPPPRRDPAPLVGRRRCGAARGRPLPSAVMSNAAQFIFTMRKVSRFHPPDREVLKDITLAFYPGAKIGVIGPNGSGKSSLLRIMAGVDDGFTGEARLSPGFTVGLLEQEPSLDETKDVKGNVMDGVAEVAGLLERYDAVLAKYADPDADYDKIGVEQAELEAKIQAAGADDLDRQIEIAMDALRLPPGDADVTDPLRRREAPRGAVPAPAVEARPAAPRRAHQPPRRRVRRVARADPARLPGHGRGHHARPVLPRQRGPLDPRARARQGPSVRGQLLELARAEAGAPRRRGEERLDPPPHARARARVGPHGAEGPPGQGQGPPGGLRQAPRRGGGGGARPGQAPDPAAARSPPRWCRDRGRRRGEGVRRPPPHRRPRLQAPARRHRRRDRPERRGQDHPVPHDHRAGAARRRHLQDR